MTTGEVLAETLINDIDQFGNIALSTDTKTMIRKSASGIYDDFVKCCEAAKPNTKTYDEDIKPLEKENAALSDIILRLMSIGNNLCNEVNAVYDRLPTIDRSIDCWHRRAKEAEKLLFIRESKLDRMSSSLRIKTGNETCHD